MEYHKLDNGWIAPPGDYQDMAKALCESDPRLSLPERKRSVHGPVRAIVFEFTKSTSGHHLVPTVFDNADQLRDHIQNPRKSSVPSEQENAIYILESLNQSVIDIMGNHFGLHPSLFLEYFRLVQTPGWGKGHSSLLASTLATRDHLLLNYRELFLLPDKAAGFHEIRCSTTGRDIDVTRVVGRFDSIGAVHRRVVFWTKPRADGVGWDCIVICDPPIRGVKITNRLSGRGVELPVVPRAEGDGYVDFLPTNIQMTTRQGPPRTCVADDLAFYISTYGSHLGMDSPDTVALLVKKLVATQYTQYFDYFRRNLRAVQRFTKSPYHLQKSDLSAVEETWIGIQAVERRLDKTILYLEETLLQIGASLDPPDPRSITSWEDVSADFRLLYHHFIYLRQSAERTNASITGLASIVGSRQAFREQQLSLHAAERSRGLTFIGLVFIPLAFVSSLFSMADPYGPGGDRFWLYFVISIPVGILVMASYYIFDMGYYSADGSGWSISNVVNSWKEKTGPRVRPDTGK